MLDRVTERRRAAQLARHYRDQEGLSIADIARRLGRAEATISEWRARYGAAPSSYDWSRTHARRRGAEALKRLHAGEWPAPSTVIDLYASWAAAVADAFGGA